MIDAKEIEMAISAHGAWKTRLRNAITSGKLDAPLEVIKADNQCMFGKWLYGPTLSTSEKLTPTFAEIKALHAEFHLCAAQIAALAATGRKDEALGMLEGSGNYTGVSGRLTMALMRWKQQVAQTASV